MMTEKAPTNPRPKTTKPSAGKCAHVMVWTNAMWRCTKCGVFTSDYHAKPEPVDVRK